jgi:hypothetical protein
MRATGTVVEEDNVTPNAVSCALAGLRSDEESALDVR